MRNLLLSTAIGAVISLLALGSVAPANGTCDPADPPSCPLRELADLNGMRIGATAEPYEIGPGPYRDTLVSEFNSVTPENALKWSTIQPTAGAWNFGPGDAVVDFAVANDLEIRGHTLVWGQDRSTPDWVEAVTDTATMRAVVEEHIGMVVGRYKDRVRRWDVVNEPLQTFGTGLSDNAYRRALGPDWIAEIFAMAAAADPTAELWLNEYGTDWVPGKHDALVALVRSLTEAGVPIDGVGLQTHRPSANGPDQALLAARITEFTDLGVEVAITELDIPIDPADAAGFTDQAAAYGRIVSACLSVKGCVEVTTWGLTDAATWLDEVGVYPTPTRPLLFDDAYLPKPAYFAVRDAFAVAAQPPTPTPSTTTVSTTAPPTPTTTTATVAAPPARSAEPVPAAPSFTG